MTGSEALSEMILYLAGAIEQGQVNAAQITGGMLRQLVNIARWAPDEVSIGTMWAAAHEAIMPAWKSDNAAQGVIIGRENHSSNLGISNE